MKLVIYTQSHGVLQKNAHSEEDVTKPDRGVGENGERK